MATAIANVNNTRNKTNSEPPIRPKLACFSFAAYAKTLIDNLKSSNIPVANGLSDSEFSSIESNFNFTFPPDLRSILQQGLPVDLGFANWRGSSPQQLQILLSLPIISVLRKVSQRKFWHPSWGPEPQDRELAMDLARSFFTRAPILVPIYRHCYIPASPNLAGNPVFYVDHDGDVRLLSFDLAGFFREAEFLCKLSGVDVPAWAATAERRIELWSDLADARLETRECCWWGCVNGELSECLEDVFWRLRDGGWREEEVREMMMMMNGCDDNDRKESGSVMAYSVRNKEGVACHVRLLSVVLLRAGWTREDVVYSLGVVGDEG
ncbi:ATP-dependent 6-phosphofructokinase [Quillaja saponaria]|uniref:ATP-dependent 6-phosphofructokinase n=1 Tax=Quillaja saponaria TaxID=32244 RepID=A0AAD7L750_QUISA|nr:ATP-dependent 6-phosphofructokinase [Quillaja saponaria]